MASRSRTDRLVSVPAVVLCAAVAGCAGNPFRKQAAIAPPSLEPPPGVAAPAHTLPQCGSEVRYADQDDPSSV
ncbi:MAG: hypothetical protein ACKON8_12775, partial [Planctomycetota bacterium]